jgi:ubiquinone biosynthesis protein COQ9
MDNADFDHALIAAWLALAADSGRQFPSVAAAAREAGLPLERARARFASRGSVLMKLGRLADQAALTGAVADGPVRDRLFDTIMRRIDLFQSHRAGVLAVLRGLPAMPPVALLLGVATERSMRWLLDASGVQTSGIAGALRVRGLVAVWLWTLRAWQTDESADLSTTMAALDRALGHAERAAGWLGGSRAAPTAMPAPPEPPPEPPPPEPPPTDPPPGPPPMPEPAPLITGMPTAPADGQPGLEPTDP